MTGRLIGHTEPRIFTPPLGGRVLTEETSRGFAFIEWCSSVLHVDLIPYQKWLAVAALELRDDDSGLYRWSTVVVLCGRQSGKSTFAACLGLWKLAEDGGHLNLGSAQNLMTATEVMERAHDLLLENAPELLPRTRNRGLFKNNNDAKLELDDGSRWRAVASSKTAGRGMSCDSILLLDELRTMTDSGKGWSSLSKTTNAFSGKAIRLCISNAGDDESVVLESLVARGREAAEDPEYRGSLGLFEFSAPPECSLDDLEAYRHSLPALGYTLTEDVIADALLTDQPSVIRTELLCQHVRSMSSMAIAESTWSSLVDPGLRITAFDRDTTTFGLDGAPDGEHATVVAACLGTDGKTRLALVASWPSVNAMLGELPSLLEDVQPAGWAWSPSGPLAAVASDLRAINDAVGGMRELSGRQVNESCQELAAKAASGRLLHGGEPLLNDHATRAKRWPQPDGGWRVVRKGAGFIDGYYACANATWLANQSVKPRVQLFV